MGSKKIIFVLLIVIISISIVGCSKVVSSEDKEIEATVIDVNYSSSYTTTTCFISNKTMIPITNYYPESFDTIVLYEGNKHYINGEDYYNICKDKKGENVKCLATKYTYNDGMYKYEIKGIVQ